jgi:monoamine oxidase
MKPRTDIVIVGAGICGLFAARELLNKGKTVAVLEATERPGGRIKSAEGNFSQQMDAGAEFIHGNMPLTRSLVREAGANFHEKEGKFYSSEKGKIDPETELPKNRQQIMSVLNSLEKDMTLSQFLSEYFGGEENKELRDSAVRLAESFDAANSDRISVFSLRKEWSNESIERSYLIEGGYNSLVEYLSEECKKKGCLIHLSTQAKEIIRKKDHVQIVCADQQLFEASQVLVTVSLGVLLSGPEEKGNIKFFPAIPEKIAAAKQMGFGPVIKINMEFQSAFWNNPTYIKKPVQLSDLGILITDSEFPVWWTKTPEEPFLTGWAGGRRAEKLITLTEADLLERGLSSLSNALFIPTDLLKPLLKAYSISNWGTQPFTKGAYSYETPETAEAKKILSEPVGNQVYFAGEALGDHLGTVESALDSAKEVVNKITR